MSPAIRLATGRVILKVIPFGTIVSAFRAKRNATHFYNSAWPQHAKFHNAPPMSMAVRLGLAVKFEMRWPLASALNR